MHTTVSSGKANDWKYWGRNVLNLLSNFKWVRSIRGLNARMDTECVWLVGHFW